MLAMRYTSSCMDVSGKYCKGKAGGYFDITMRDATFGCSKRYRSLSHYKPAPIRHPVRSCLQSDNLKRTIRSQKAKSPCTQKTKNGPRSQSKHAHGLFRPISGQHSIEDPGRRYCSSFQKQLDILKFSCLGAEEFGSWTTSHEIGI